MNALDLQPLPDARRVCSQGNSPSVLANIYEDNVNISLWQRLLDDDLASASTKILQAKPTLKLATVVGTSNTEVAIQEALGSTRDSDILGKDIAYLVDIFSCLFEIERVGLRLVALNKAMCPRFHVDHVPCRLITTYTGNTTQWLRHEDVDRSKLGSGNLDKCDEISGLFKHISDIQNLKQGDVALLKGERWDGNEGAGLVHRSPKVSDGSRLVLTLDFANN